MDWDNPNVVRGAVRDTEFEIMADALNVEPNALPNAPSEHIEGGDDFGDTEGWDGNPLGNEEVAAVNLHGHPDTGQDRPLQYAEELGYEGQIQQQRGYIDQLHARMAELEQRADPQLQERIRQQREEMIVQMIANPDAALQLIGMQNARIQQLQLGRADAAMDAGLRRFGKDFERAYDAVHRLERGNPVAQQIVHGILTDKDPRQALMDWYEVAGGRGRQPPFMGGSGGGGMRITRSLNDATGWSGSGGAHSPFSSGDYEAATSGDEEAGIWDHAMRGR